MTKASKLLRILNETQNPNMAGAAPAPEQLQAAPPAQDLNIGAMPADPNAGLAANPEVQDPAAGGAVPMDNSFMDIGQDPSSMGGDPSMMGADPNAMGGDPSMMGAYPTAMGGDPSMMGADPNAMGGDPAAMGGDPAAMGGDPSMMGADPNVIGGDPAAMGGDPVAMAGDPNAASAVDMNGNPINGAPAGGQQEDPMSQLDSEIFQDLSDEEVMSRNKKLKNGFVKLYDIASNVIDKIMDADKSENTLSVTEFIISKLTHLRSMITDYINDIYDSKSYIENYLYYNECLSILKGINNLLNEIEQKDLNNN